MSCTEHTLFAQDCAQCAAALATRNTARARILDAQDAILDARGIWCASEDGDFLIIRLFSNGDFEQASTSIRRNGIWMRY